MSQSTVDVSQERAFHYSNVPPVHWLLYHAPVSPMSEADGGTDGGM